MSEEVREAASGPREPSIDEQIVWSLVRWALVTTLAIFAYDVAAVSAWPFPGWAAPLRGPFYTLAGIVLIAAALVIAFLGYRVISLRFVRFSRVLYLLFFPAIALVASGVGFLFLNAQR